MKHMAGTREEKDAGWNLVSGDIDLVHGACSEADFASRCKAVRHKCDKPLLS